MTLLLEKILPLYLFIFIGFVAARQLLLDKRSISALVIYFITPVIVFYGTAKISFSLQTIILPLLSFLFFSVSGLCARMITGFIPSLRKYQDMLSFMGGNGNTGYFGIPLVVGILGESYFSYAVLVGLGALLFENSLGMYFLAKKEFSGSKALKKVASMPTIYGFLLGSLVSFLGMQFSPSIDSVFQMYKSCYIVIGMMIIGIGLYREETGAISLPFLCYNLVHKFMIMPCLFFVLFFVSSILVPSIQPFASVYYLISIVPLAAGSISLAIEFKHDVYNVAMSVLISTFIALPVIYVLHLFL